MTSILIIACLVVAIMLLGASMGATLTKKHLTATALGFSSVGVGCLPFFIVLEAVSKPLPY